MDRFLYAIKIIFKYLTYLAILALLVFTVYKFFNWKKIFDREYDSSQSLKRKIDLPPMIKSFYKVTDFTNQTATNTSTTKIDSREMSYEYQLFLEQVLEKLALQNVKIIQIEYKENDSDFSLLTTRGYKIYISSRLSKSVLFDNIISVYASKLEDKDFEVGPAGDALDYIDFRFKDKVFYKYKK